MDLFAIVFGVLPVVAGELHAVCPIEEVEAFQGDDVWLQCHTDPQTDLSQLTVDWKRPDLGCWVYVYRNQKDDPEPLTDQYRGRMKVDHGGLHRGNLTLFIPSVAPSDSGPYRSFIPRHRAGCTVQLTVVNRTRDVFSTATPSSRAPHRDAVTPTETPIIVTVCVLVVVVVVAVVAAVVVVVVVLRKRKQDDRPEEWRK